MDEQLNQQQIARHVRAVYNYNVGQKAGAGLLILAAIGVSVLIYAGLLFAGLIGSLL